MLRKKAFWKKLKKETPQWVTAGIIDPVQQETILAQYAPKPSNVRARLPVIVIGLAVILIGVGLFLFYAANWRKMPPVFKLVQVFALMIGLNGLSYYLLAARQKSERIGRAFLRLGMVAFGVGIALVAQIYHLSAHPSNGVLLWSLGVLAMAWVTRDRWGYYLTLLLACIWNWWEYFEYGRPNYLFGLFPLLILLLFVQIQEKIGALLSAVALLFWYHQVHLYWVHEFDLPVALFFLLYLPFGLILIALGRAGEQSPPLLLTSRAITFLGWAGVFLPLIVLSWPGDWFDALFPWFDGRLISFEFLLLMGIAAALIYRRFRQGEPVTLMAACWGYGLFTFLLPLGHLTTFVLFTHVGLLAYFFGLLSASYRDFPERHIERFLAFALPIVMICSKGIGFLALGFDSERFLVAYGIGFIIFGTVCLLINQAVKLLIAKDDPEFPDQIINSVCAVMGFGTLYALSFRVEDQTSVFQTTPVVLALLLMFIGLALGLYALLWLKSSEKLVLGLSALIFFAALCTLLISGPQISWVVYSLIFNILLFLMTATLIYYSTRINSAKLANLAILGFVVHVVTRYFDIFLDLFSGALLFIITGLLALGGGYLLERNRRKFIQHIQEHSQEEQP